MKKSQIFWLVSISLFFALGNIFSAEFREKELSALIVIISIYLFINVVMFLAWLINGNNIIDDNPMELLIIYWVIIYPINKFNTWLDKE